MPLSSKSSDVSDVEKQCSLTLTSIRSACGITSSSMMVIIGASVGGLVLVGAGVGAFFMMRRRSQASIETSKSLTPQA
jgi:hypothetical protein